MRNTRTRSIVLSLMTLLFLFGIGLFVFRYITNASSWAFSPVNKHFSREQLVKAGDIVDCNNVLLAHSENGKRKYNDDENTRRALLHTVGDNTSHIPSSVQTLYHDELYGYNFILGVNSPEVLGKSKNIKITLDSEVCKVALNALGSHKGAVCVYNYKTGEIVCMVSTPTYDPYHPEVVEKDSSEKYEGAYINRVLNSSYTPGSVFKIITSASGLAYLDDMENKTYSCHQTELVNNKKITCLGSHGDINLKNAMMRSCNIYFADLAIELGNEQMTNTANSMGFNRSFQIDRVKTKKSFYNVDKADDYNLGWSGIGQYNDLLNPMHSVILMGAVANSGEACTPHFIKDIYLDKPSSNARYRTLGSKEKLLPKNTADILKGIMRYNVTANYGDSMFPHLNVCAKTGTAEVGEDKEPHGWMIGFSSNDDTPLAFCVIVENSGYGSKTAGPIAEKVLNYAAKRLK